MVGRDLGPLMGGFDLSGCVVEVDCVERSVGLLGWCSRAWQCVVEVTCV